eukprot:500088-Amphidinium_carterae.1
MRFVLGKSLKEIWIVMAPRHDLGGRRHTYIRRAQSQRAQHSQGGSGCNGRYCRVASAVGAISYCGTESRDALWSSPPN